MKKISFLLLVSFLITFSTTGKTQNDCFIQLGDLSGFNTAPYQAELEAAACELISLLPQDFSQDFIVFNIDFYSHSQSYIGSTPVLFNSATIDAESISPFFLIFGNQLDHSGNVEKIYLSFKLPTTGSLFCFDQNERFTLEQELLIYANQENEKEKKSIENYHKVLIKTVAEFSDRLGSIINWCFSSNPDDCTFCLSDKNRTKMLCDMGFVPIPIENAYENVPLTIISDENVNNRYSGFNIHDHGIRGPNVIEIGGVTANIGENISNFLNDIENFDYSINIQITSNKNLCENAGFDLAKNEFENSDTDFKIWFHIDEEHNFLFINDQSDFELDWDFSDIDSIPASGLPNVFVPQLQFAGDQPVYPNYDRPDYPNVFKRFWNYYQDKWHITRAFQFAYDWNIPENDIYYYAIPEDGKQNSYREFILIYHHNVDPPSPPGGDYQNVKHIFRRHKEGVFWSSDHANDTRWLKWTNLWDDQGYPIITDEDLKGTLPGSGFNFLEAVEFIDATVGVYAAGKWILKKAGSRLIAKKTSTIAGKRVFKIYVFQTSKGLYYGQTIQKLSTRIAQHSAAGKNIVQSSKNVLAEIPEHIPNS
ncbi:MAG TPA: hypothetical protein PLU49_14190, partial [Saprospiraceae bacterium]|nr:hypothetical protein [Saprospiraceae bacterium]